MAFYSWADLLSSSPPAFVTGVPSGVIARSVAQATQAARVSNPYRFASNPDYSAPGPTPIWVDPNAFWDEALGRVPLVSDSIPIGTGDYSVSGLVYGAVSVWYNEFTEAEEEEKVGILDPALPYPGTPMAFGQVSGAAYLATVTSGFRQWVFNVTSGGVTGQVQLSSAYNPSLYTSRGLRQVVVAPFGSTASTPATEFPRTPVTYLPTSDPVPMEVEIPAIPGVLPNPVRIPLTIPNPEEFGRRPVPVVPPVTLPQEQRRAIPGITLLPGGIQVGGGSQGDPLVYTPPDIIPDTLPELEEIIREQIPGAECPQPPDPCEEVDYQRIQDSMVGVLSRRMRLPGVTAETSLGADFFGTNLVIPLSDDMVAIRFVLDEGEFFGGLKVGGRPEFNFFFCGWYSFRGPQSNRGYTERHFLGTRQGSIEIPLWASAFCVNLIDGMTGTFTPVLVDPIPEA